MKNDLIAARLDLIAAKAKILSEQYKSSQLWAGDLGKQLSDIEVEINNIRNGSGNADTGWATSRSGSWYPDDK